MDYHKALPFYVAYPEYNDWNPPGEDRILEDLEYLQQMYPASAKRYQTRISEILNRIDYDGSMIYDQYPDRWQLERLAKDVLAIIKSEEQKSRENLSGITTFHYAEDDTKWEWILDLVTVLLYYEILKRRRMKRNYYYF